MLEVKNIVKSYDGKIKAVNDISFNVKGGEIYGLIGSNGAGKSTSLKMISGILVPDFGSIKIDGKDIVLQSVEAKKLLAFVADEPNMFLNFRAIEFFNFIADVYEVSAAKRKILIDEYVSTFNLSDALYKKINSFSHGMRQKVFIIAALLHEPKLWILDEPLTGLDPQSVYNLKTIMKKYVEAGNSVLFSSHVLDVVEKICDRIGIIHKGNLVFEGSLLEFKNSAEENKSLEQIFMNIVDNSQNLTFKS